MLVSDIQTALEIETGFAVITVRLEGGVYSAIATDPQHQAAVDAALAGVVAALEAQETTNIANKSAAAAMIATFAVSEAAIEYFNALQEAIRDVSDNNSIDIATVFPAMKALLDDHPTLYQRYLNLLRISTGISQATFEATPTAAQQRNAFIVALEFANTGMIQMLMGALFS